jgi:hypothetical protein
MNIFDHPAVVGILIGLPSVSLGYLAYRRSTRAEQAAQKNGTIGRIYSGFGELIDNLQEDNAGLRSRVEQLARQRDELAAENERSRGEVAGLYHRIAMLENRETP